MRLREKGREREGRRRRKKRRGHRPNGLFTSLLLLPNDRAPCHVSSVIPGPRHIDAQRRSRRSRRVVRIRVQEVVLGACAAAQTGQLHRDFFLTSEWCCAEAIDFFFHFHFSFSLLPSISLLYWFPDAGDKLARGAPSRPSLRVDEVSHARSAPRQI